MLYFASGSGGGGTDIDRLRKIPPYPSEQRKVTCREAALCGEKQRRVGKGLLRRFVALNERVALKDEIGA